MKKLLAMVGAALSLLVPIGTALAAVIYENDFSIRVSTSPIPYSGWREVPYSVGTLANQTNPFQASSNDYDYQDNWILDNAYGRSAVVDIDGNPEAMIFKSPSDVADVCVKHRLGNTFTTGVVRVQCDMKTPTAGNWGSDSSRSFRLLLGDENFFSPETPPGDVLTKHLAGGAGISMAISNGEYRFFLYGYATATINSGGYVTDPLPLSGHWYRTVITANAGTMKYNVAIYDMGMDHPSKDAATPASPAWSTNDVPFRCMSLGMSSSFKGISAVGLYCYGASGDATASYRSAHFDNLRVWHNDVECYANDFTSRRSRSLAAAATTAGYEAPAVNADSENRIIYPIDTKLFSPLDTTLEKQPIGFDGWRNVHGTGKVVPVTGYYAQTGACVLMFTNNNSHCIAVQPIGRTFSSGKVRFCVDARVEFGSGGDSDTYMEAMLGSDKLYDSISRKDGNGYNGYNDGVFARSRIEKTPNGTDGGVSKRTTKWGTSTDGAGSGKGMTAATEGVATGGKWYRIELIADIDNGTYDYTVYNVCSSSSAPSFGQATLGVLFQQTEINRYVGVTSISHFALDSFGSKTYFDNVGIWHKPAGAASEQLVYKNTSDARTVYGVETAETPLVGALQKSPVGIDGWTRQYKTSDAILLVGGENPALGFANYTTVYSSFATHDLGGLYKDGKLTAQFDMCAQKTWSESGGFYFWLGGDRFHEGNMYGGSSGDDWFANWSACGIGLASLDAANPDTVKFASYQGNGTGGGNWQKTGSVTLGNWYRFVVKADITFGVSNVAIYDMGTTQPTLTTPTPNAPVQTFAAVPFRRNIKDVSSFGFQAQNPAASVLVADERRALIDNLRFDYSPNGLIITFR